MDLQSIRDLATQDITAAAGEGEDHRVPTVMGFDGFIDHIIDVVDTREVVQPINPWLRSQPLASRADYRGGWSQHQL